MSTGNSVRYRYYVSRSLQHDAAAASNRLRVLAREIEALVATGIAALLDDPVACAGTAGIEITPHGLPGIIERCQAVALGLRHRSASTCARSPLGCGSAPARSRSRSKRARSPR